MEIAVGATACVRYLEVVRFSEGPLRPCFIDSLFPVTRPHPFQAAAPKIIIELACYEYH